MNCLLCRVQKKFCQSAKNESLRKMSKRSRKQLQFGTREKHLMPRVSTFHHRYIDTYIGKRRIRSQNIAADVRMAP